MDSRARQLERDAKHDHRASLLALRRECQALGHVLRRTRIADQQVFRKPSTPGPSELALANLPTMTSRGLAFECERCHEEPEQFTRWGPWLCEWQDLSKTPADCQHAWDHNLRECALCGLTERGRREIELLRARGAPWLHRAILGFLAHFGESHAAQSLELARRQREFHQRQLELLRNPFFDSALGETIEDPA